MADSSLLHPGLSVDCVIFGFHEGALKVLLLRMKNMDKWALPGGFVEANEDVDVAAHRVLQERTGVSNVFLKQFRLFGNPTRIDATHNQFLSEHDVIAPESVAWFQQRFVTMGYYALINFSRVTPTPDPISQSCEWMDVASIPELILDHRQILDEALETLRKELRYLPVGMNLLPAKFTMPELQELYETILNRPLDRRNFQRKILALNILVRHEERKTGGAFRAPYLYSFDSEKYAQALATGLGPDW